MKRLIKYVRVRFRRRVRFEMTVSDFIKILEYGCRESAPSVQASPRENLGRHCGLK
jgi:hypothetical protein